MPLVIHLTDAEETRLAARAEREGLSPDELARRLLAQQLPPSENASGDPTLALFERWSEEDAAMTAEERDHERRLWQDFEHNVDETRRALGMRPL